MQHPVVTTLIAAVALVASLTPAVAVAQARDVMLVLDNSGSMRENDPDFLTPVAVESFIRNLRGDVRLGVIIFDEDVDLAVPLSPLDVDTRGRYLASLERVDFRGQWTDSSAALERAVYALRTEGRPQAHKSIVFMTDGIVDTGDAARDVERTRWMQEELSAQAAEAGVRIFAIAFTDKADFQLIQSLAHRTHGDYYRAYAAGDIERVFLDLNATLEAAQAAAPSLDAAPEPLPQTSPDVTALPAPAPLTALPVPVPAPAPAPTAAAPELPVAPPTLPAPTIPTTAPTTTRLPPSLPQAEPPRVAGSRASADLLAELGAPPADADAAAADDAATGEPDAGPAPAPAHSGAATRQSPAKPPPAATGLESSMPWLLAGGGAILALGGGGVFLWLRRRKPAASTPGVPKAFLNDLGGATDKSSHELGGIPTVVGRMPGGEGDGANYVVIEESTIGRRHAIIEYAEHAYWVADQNSLNGTYVNNERIRQRVRLKHGDRIRFHRREFEFVMWDMFETDRTEMSHTRFAQMCNALDDDADATQMRDPLPRLGSAPTITRR